MTLIQNCVLPVHGKKEIGIDLQSRICRNEDMSVFCDFVHDALCNLVISALLETDG